MTGRHMHTWHMNCHKYRMYANVCVNVHTCICACVCMTIYIYTYILSYVCVFNHISFNIVRHAGWRRCYTPLQTWFENLRICGRSHIPTNQVSSLTKGYRVKQWMRFRQDMCQYIIVHKATWAQMNLLCPCILLTLIQSALRFQLDNGVWDEMWSFELISRNNSNDRLI